jgi:hypothetical protein
MHTLQPLYAVLADHVWPAVVRFWVFCTLLSLALNAIPDARYQAIEAWWPRLGHLLRAIQHAGSCVVPFVQCLIKAFTGAPLAPVARAIVPALVLVGLALPPTGCTGAQRAGDGGGVPSVTITIGVTLTAAHGAVTIAKTALDGLPQVDATTRATVTQALRVADDSIGLANDALLAYEHDQSAANQCRLRTDIDSGVGALLQTVVLLHDAGVQVPPEVPISVGGLGAIADALLPGCPDPTPTAARVRAALHGGT